MNYQTSFYKQPVFRIILFGILLATVLILVLGPKLPSRSDRKIVVGDAVFAHLLGQWQKTWQRPPTLEELQGVVESYVREEILYQEALNEGLQDNNAMVKRALIMQMNMLGASQGSGNEITQDDVAAYYELRKEKFTRPAKISLAQVYFSTDNNKNAEELAKEAVLQLNANNIAAGTTSGYGDATMLTANVPLSSSPQIDSNFGEGFAEKLLTLPTEEWAGPIQSSFGWHAVFIKEKTDGGAIPLDEVYNEVLREMQFEEKEAATEQFYTDLLQRYEVIYEGEIKEVVNAK